jgi:hypothetical protein
LVDIGPVVLIGAKVGWTEVGSGAPATGDLIGSGVAPGTDLVGIGVDVAAGLAVEDWLLSLC